MADLDLHFLTDAADPRLDPYRLLKDHQLRLAHGLFVAESELVVRKLLDSTFVVRSLLLTAPRLAAMEGVLTPAHPVYVVPQAVMDRVAGLPVHRGCLAVGERPSQVRLPAVATTVLVLDELVDVDNVGALVRHAAAFGADAVLLSPGCADPYYRKAIRVSMGAVFTVPIVRASRWPDDLIALRASHGCTLVAAVVDRAAATLWSWHRATPVAVVLGAEGPGLAPATRDACDVQLTIPMHSADSLNVATAGALFLYELTVRRHRTAITR